MIYTIFYKNYLGKWKKDKVYKYKVSAEKRLNWIKKHKAENGVAEIFRNKY